MKGLQQLRDRYMQDPIPVRLGGLAANLSRVASFSEHAGHREAVLEMLEESKWFIEWTASELEIERTAELVRLQVQLALWQLQSQTEWDNVNWRNDLAVGSRQLSDRLLEMSGLLTVS
jgi:hypothetical protein